MHNLENWMTSNLQQKPPHEITSPLQ